MRRKGVWPSRGRGLTGMWIMRLWTVHPLYLDGPALVALWREGLLAKAVLSGRTRGYRRHPQLERFRNAPAPLAAINSYLAAVLAEAKDRGYAFDGGKLDLPAAKVELAATDGQLLFEWAHLLAKLRERSPAVYERWRGLESPAPHPLFRLVPGPVEPWERGPGRAPLKRRAALPGAGPPE